MKSGLMAACAAVLLGTAAAESEWKPLFNGKDLQGWSVKSAPADQDKAYWSATNGVIAVHSIHHAPTEYVWLVNEGEYADFELRLQFQVFKDSPGNSGVQIRSRYDDAAGWLDGPQLDIHPPNPMRAGLIYDETRAVQRWISPSLEKGNHNIPKEQTNPNIQLVYGEGNWNEMRVLAEGTRIQCWINGERATDFDGAGLLDDEAHTTRDVGLSGHIALQLHRKNQLRANFKDIQIRER